MQNVTSTNYPTTATTHHHCKSTLSWGSVFAGTVAALSIATLFHLLGLALGFSVFSPDVNTMTAIGTGSLIWLGLTGIISMFIGGWIAGKTTRFGYSANGGLHGFITWGVATLLIFMLTTTAVGAFVTAGAVSILNKDSALTMQQNMTPKASYTTVNNYPMQNLQNQQNIKMASSVISSIAFATFSMFLLSAIFGIIGGCIGGRKHHCTHRHDDVRTTDVNS